jgi:transposase
MPRSGVRDDANLREVFYKDFRNRREVASYFGLTPSPWQSGGIDRLACA